MSWRIITPATVIHVNTKEDYFINAEGCDVKKEEFWKRVNLVLSWMMTFFAQQVQLPKCKI